MDINEFWLHIQTSNEQSNGDMEKKSVIIKSIISKMSASEATEFLHHFNEAMDRALSWDLWGAAYLVHGGCSDDGFSDFRASLISRGEDVFNKTVSNPDILAEEFYDEDTWFFEGFDYAVREAAEAVAGNIERSKRANQEPSGEQWEEEQSYFESVYPKLWEKFGHEWDFSGYKSQGLPIKPWWKFW